MSTPERKDPALFERIAVPRTSEVAARHVADLVLRRRLTDGDRLPSEADLATRLGISRVSARQALRLLQGWGLVHVERGRGHGAVVRQPGVVDMTRSVATALDSGSGTLVEVTHARIAIEGACIRLAAERRDQEALRELLTSVDRVDPGTRQWEEHTVAFHTALAAATGNGVLETVVASLSGMIRFSASLTSVSLVSQAETLRAHRRIAEALLAGKTERAERRLVKHLAGFLDLVRSTYDLDMGNPVRASASGVGQRSSGVRVPGRAPRTPPP